MAAALLHLTYAPIADSAPRARYLAAPLACSVLHGVPANDTAPSVDGYTSGQIHLVCRRAGLPTSLPRARKIKLGTRRLTAAEEAALATHAARQLTLKGVG